MDSDNLARLGDVLLLGRDYGRYGNYFATTVGSQTAAAISVGSDRSSPSLRFKGDPHVQNEDALCVAATGQWVGLAVADAHYGSESSELLVTEIYHLWSQRAPSSSSDLSSLLDALNKSGVQPLTQSETSLLIVVYDSVEKKGVAISFGDSTLTIAGPGRVPHAINQRNQVYVSAATDFGRHASELFEFEASEGELLLLFSDGIDECHYRSAETSIRPQDIAALSAEVAYDPLAMVQRLTTLALAGVRGNPGGQDNIAVIAAAT